MNSMKWYETAYRRHLADMHIEDWNEEFLRDFSPEEYVANLKRAHIQAPMIYLQSHVGYCNYPTQSGKAHRAMQGNYTAIQKLVDLCHEEGMSVVGYYSLIYNTWAHDNYPEWRMTDATGKSVRERVPHYRYGFCCPNNQGYREFVYRQIDEIAATFKLEGMFFDMLFWPDICHCPACEARWAREVGGNIPTEIDWNEPSWKLFNMKRSEWMGEFARSVADYAKKVMPGITVEHNYASAVAGDWHNAEAEFVNESCDYAGGDLYGDLYNHSFTAKYYLNVTNNQPFEYMTGRCVESLAKHTLTKSERSLGLEILLTAAHHGASFVIDAVDPRGTMDKRVYERIGRVFERQMPYEKYFSVGKHVEDVAVFYSTTGRYNPNGDPWDGKTAAVNAVRKLISGHVPVGVISNAMKQRLEDYQAVVVPMAAGLFPAAREAIIAYVRNGGRLYFSGNGEETLLKEFFGAEILGLTRANCTYVAPCAGKEAFFSEFNADYPMPADCRQVMLRVKRGEVLATVKLPYTARDEDAFASIHSDPPGVDTAYPSVILADYGKGQVLWSAAPVEAFDSWQYEDIFLGFVRMLSGGNYTFFTDAPSGVEVVAFKTGEGYLVSAIDLLSGKEDVNRGGFSVSLCGEKLREAHILPTGEALPVERKGDFATVKIPSLSQFVMIELK